jgi:purine nucleoside permease
MRKWTSQWISSQVESPPLQPGVYTTTLMEDIGFAIAARRLDQTGRLCFDRLMQLRGVGNFDRPYPGQSTVASLKESDAVEVAFDLAMDNLYNAGSVIVKDILQNWEKWKEGPPCADSGPV